MPLRIASWEVGVGFMQPDTRRVDECKAVSTSLAWLLWVQTGHQYSCSNRKAQCERGCSENMVGGTQLVAGETSKQVVTAVDFAHGMFDVLLIY